MYSTATRISISFFLVTVLFCSIVSAPSSATAAAVHKPTVTVRDIVVHTNHERVAIGVTPVTHDTRLSVIAAKKARLMAERENFAHTLADGTTAWSLMVDAGYSYTAAGENLAVLYESSAATVAAWMQSDTHRATLLDDTYAAIGIGIATGTYAGYDGYYVVQLLARPL